MSDGDAPKENLGAKLKGMEGVGVSNMMSGASSSPVDFFHSEGIMSLGAEGGIPTFGETVRMPLGIGEKGLPDPTSHAAAVLDHKVTGSTQSQFQALNGINPEGASLSNIGVPAGSNMSKGGHGFGIGGQ